jgi:hypothetical protein
VESDSNRLSRFQRAASTRSPSPHGSRIFTSRTARPAWLITVRCYQATRCRRDDRYRQSCLFSLPVLLPPVGAKFRAQSSGLWSPSTPCRGRDSNAHSAAQRWRACRLADLDGTLCRAGFVTPLQRAGFRPYHTRPSMSFSVRLSSPGVSEVVAQAISVIRIAEHTTNRGVGRVGVEPTWTRGGVPPFVPTGTVVPAPILASLGTSPNASCVEGGGLEPPSQRSTTRPAGPGLPLVLCLLSYPSNAPRRVRPSRDAEALDPVPPAVRRGDQYSTGVAHLRAPGRILTGGRGGVEPPHAPWRFRSSIGPWGGHPADIDAIHVHGTTARSFQLSYRPMQMPHGV